MQEAWGGGLKPADLRVICDSLNNECSTGGQSKLARLLGWHHSTVWRKLNGRSPISQSDELAIRQAVSSPAETPCICPAGGILAEKGMHTRFSNRRK